MGRAHEVRAASMAKTSAIKSKINAKHSTAIYVAAKSGIPDPETNNVLKSAIEKARKDNVPADVINRAIEKAKGGTTDAYNFVRYEGFGPNNSLFIVDCLTDNVNRTYTAVKTAFSKSNGNLGENGTVTYMFGNYSIFQFEGYSVDEIMETLLEADCDIIDVTKEDEMLEVLAEPTEYGKVRDTLYAKYKDIKFEKDETVWIPNHYVELTDENDIKNFNKLMDTLDELEDVQTIYFNVSNLRSEE